MVGKGGERTRKHCVLCCDIYRYQDALGTGNDALISLNPVLDVGGILRLD